MPRKVILNVSIEPRQLAEVDRYAEETGRTRSAAVRWLLDTSPQLTAFRQAPKAESSNQED
jgi:hypothetical protein